MYHSPGRPLGDWDQESWRKQHSENFEQHVLHCVISYLKTYKSKGYGIALFDLSRDIHHRPYVIRHIVDKYHGTWMNGVLGKSEAKGGYYVVWSRVGEDPILCIHEAWAEIYEVVVKEGQAFAICDRCGSRYILPSGNVEIDWSLNDVTAQNTLDEMWGEPFVASGRVLDSVTRISMPQVEVKVMLSQWPYISWRSLGKGLTDNYGNFAVDLTDMLKTLQPNRYVLLVDASFYDMKFAKVNDAWLHLNLAERSANPAWTRLQRYATVDVFVKDEECYVEGCEVSLCQGVGSVKALTDSYGHAKFTFMPLGMYRFKATRDGYKTIKFEVNLENPYQSSVFTVNMAKYTLADFKVPIAGIVAVGALVTAPFWLPKDKR